MISNLWLCNPSICYSVHPPPSDGLWNCREEGTGWMSKTQSSFRIPSLLPRTPTCTWTSLALQLPFGSEKGTQTCHALVPVMVYIAVSDLTSSAKPKQSAAQSFCSLRGWTRRIKLVRQIRSGAMRLAVEIPGCRAIDSFGVGRHRMCPKDWVLSNGFVWIWLLL